MLSLTNPSAAARRRSAKTKSARRSLRVEMLETRQMLATLLVASDLLAHPDAQYTSIQAAVTAAQSGDTVQVYAGAYNEAVTVDKTLKLLGAQHGVAGSRAFDAANESVVTPTAGAAAFQLNANDIVLDGFTVQGALDAAGIATAAATSGNRIVNNIIQDNTFGLALNASGPRTTIVRNNAFLNNNAAGAHSGIAIYSDQGLQRAVIQHNTFSQQQTAAIDLAGGTTTTDTQKDVAIVDNRLTNDSSIMLANVSRALVSHNDVLASTGHAVVLGGGVTDTAVVGNRLEAGTASGIVVAAAGGVGANTRNLISGNRVSGFAEDGIRLDGADHTAVTLNRVDGNAANGIALLGAATKNLVSLNRVTNNTQSGIAVNAAAVDNLFSLNTAEGNGAFDYRDDSVGSKTQNTANTWIGNRGTLTSPANLANPARRPFFRGWRW